MPDDPTISDLGTQYNDELLCKWTICKNTYHGFKYWTIPRYLGNILSGFEVPFTILTLQYGLILMIWILKIIGRYRYRYSYC